MNEKQRIVVVSKATRLRLEELKLEKLKKGISGVTLGGLVDEMVLNAYESKNV